METTNLLPLGSIVIVDGGVKKVMIISRAMMLPQEGENKLFDYGACLYPEGLTGDQVLYFNHENIAKVLHEGFVDEDNTLMLETIHRKLEQEPVKKAVLK